MIHTLRSAGGVDVKCSLRFMTAHLCSTDRTNNHLRVRAQVTFPDVKHADDGEAERPTRLLVSTELSASSSVRACVFISISDGPANLQLEEHPSAGAAENWTDESM